MSTNMENGVDTEELSGGDQQDPASDSRSQGAQPPQDAGHGRSSVEDRIDPGHGDIPKTPDGYAIELPDGMNLSTEDQAALKALLPAAHSAGVSNQAMTALVTGYAQLTARAQADLAGQLNAAKDEHAAALRREWGDAGFEQRINVAKDVATQVGGKAFKELLRSAIVPGGNGKPPSYLGDHPAMITFLASVGSGAVKSARENGERVRQTVQDQIGAMLKQNPVGTPGYSDKAFQKRLSALYEQLHGNGPIVGSDMRTL